MTMHLMGQLTTKPIVDLFKMVDQLEASGEVQKVAELYKLWLAANPNDGLLHVGYFNYSVVLSRLGDRAGAINALRECIRMKPDFYPPYINLGRLLEDFGQAGSAVSHWLELVKSLGTVDGNAVRHKTMVLKQIARVLEENHLDGQAEDAMRQALDLNLDNPDVVQHYIAIRQRQCKWPAVDGWEGVAAEDLMAGISPLSAAVMTDDPLFQLARNASYGRTLVKVDDVPDRTFAERRRPLGGRKLKIGYLSSDLRQHAVGFGLAEVMEVHDRSRFEIHAYYCGIERDDPTKARIKASVDRWTDIRGMAAADAAERIHGDEIDILIDFNGYTRDAKTEVFAHRPAPIIANWFGFPGTMGTPFHHYIIADPIVIPEGDEIYFSEKVVRLPCYQPNDRKRTVSDKPPSRADEGLPEGVFVYCSLNGTQKITPETFRMWIEVLKQVPDSVLWLLGATDEANARLRGMAEYLGVSGSRLVFAVKRPNPEHLARYRLADVFLDTFPYGAHTTAADALWMGVPIVTVPGNTFATKVCADIVTCAGLPELVCATPGEFVAKAVELGRNRDMVSVLRRRLDATRMTSTTFDTDRLVRSLEALYVDMWADFEHDRLPRPDLANLEVYEQIGVELNLKPRFWQSREALHAAYLERLRKHDALYPLQPDTRLWRR